ncbi:MAG: periplasmic heavy metal sensor [Roseovarius sp.]
MTAPSSPPTPEANGKPRLWLRVVFVLSLGLNLLILGAVLGAALSNHGWRHDRHPPRLETSGGPLTRALSEADRRAIARQMRRAYLGDEAARRARAEGFEALVADLRAVPFDRAAVEARLTEMQGQFHERLATGQRMLLDRIEGMTDAERAAYADRLETARSRRD